MSTHPPDDRSRQMDDPTKDEYRDLEKKLGAGEYALAADIATDSKALDAAAKAARQQTRSAISDARPGRDKPRSRGTAR